MKLVDGFAASKSGKSEPEANLGGPAYLRRQRLVSELDSLMKKKR